MPPTARLWSDERERVRLLVKCEREELTDVLAALAETKAEVWDLATMKRVKAAPPPAEAQPTPKRPVVVPPLRDAGKVMEEILTTVGQIQGRGQATAPRVTELVVKPRGAVITLLAGSGWDVDQVRLALAANAWLKPRLQRVETGAAQRIPNAGIQTKLSLKFDPSRSEPGVLTPLTQLDMQVIEQAVRAVKMQYVRAGAVASDPDRKAGFVTTWRDFTFQAAKLTSLRALILTLAKAHPGLVVFEVRYKDNGSGYALGPVLRLGGRAPLGR